MATKKQGQLTTSPEWAKQGLLQEVEAWPEGLKKAELWVASELTLNGERVANDVAMANR